VYISGRHAEEVEVELQMCALVLMIQTAG
jgi:hypothetical protein